MIFFFFKFEKKSILQGLTSFLKFGSTDLREIYKYFINRICIVSFEVSRPPADSTNISMKMICYNLDHAKESLIGLLRVAMTVASSHKWAFLK